MSAKVPLTDKNTIVKILTDFALASPAGPFQFFRNLIQQMNIPKEMKAQLGNVGQIAPDIDARNLVEYAAVREQNPTDPSYTVLGSVLEVVIDNNAFDLTSRRVLAVIVVAYRLYRKDALLINLMERFTIPQPAKADAGVAAGAASLAVALSNTPGTTVVGPDIQWRETDPTRDPDLQLQAWPWSTPDYLDVGFLMRATECAAAVCRVEVPSKKRTGTGFLIAPDLLLTNYHVLCYDAGEDINQSAAETILRFGFITLADGANATGQTFKLAENPILSSSPIAKLDYVLLRVEDAVTNASGVKPIRLIANSPETDKALNIIQHPEGETLKIALSSNGISGIYKDSGLIQYVSRAAGGSSGSPCFNDQWQLIAVHHAERAKVFGSIREGILFSSINEEISKVKEIADALPK